MHSNLNRKEPQIERARKSVLRKTSLSLGSLRETTGPHGNSISHCLWCSVIVREQPFQWPLRDQGSKVKNICKNFVLSKICTERMEVH